MAEEPDIPENKTVRIHMLMSPSEVEAIDDWGFEHRVRTRGEAIRRLCQMGIIYDRELKPMVDRVTEHIRASIAEGKPKLTQSEHQQMFQDMAISLFNAGTVSSKLNAESTEDAVKAVLNLYAYYNVQKPPSTPE